MTVTKKELTDHLPKLNSHSGYLDNKPLPLIFIRITEQLKQ